MAKRKRSILTCQLLHHQFRCGEAAIMQHASTPPSSRFLPKSLALLDHSKCKLSRMLTPRVHMSDYADSVRSSTQRHTRSRQRLVSSASNTEQRHSHREIVGRIVPHCPESMMPHAVWAFMPSGFFFFVLNDKSSVWKRNDIHDAGGGSRTCSSCRTVSAITRKVDGECAPDGSIF